MVGNLRPDLFWHMMSFNWKGEKLRHGKIMDPATVSVPNNKGNRLNTDFKDHYQAVQAVGV